MPRLPAANEFTPGQLGGEEALFDLLDEITRAAGNRAAVVEWIRERWFDDAARMRADNPESQREQQLKRANNVVTGMQQYGLLEPQRDPLVPSDLGKEVLSKSDSRPDGFAVFARFLLRERHGLELLQIAEDVRNRGGFVTKKQVDDELRIRGYAVSTNSSYSGKLRQWLEPSGVVDFEWNVNHRLLAEIAGAGPSDVVKWRSLSVEQRAVVEVLRVRALGNRTPIQSAELLDLVRQRGVEFNAGLVGRQVYEPLIAAGLVVREVKSDGRGGKGGTIELTDYGFTLDAALIDGLDLGDIPPDLQVHLSKSTANILERLNATDKGEKGIALELLALRMAADVGLIPADLRLRSAQTGGAEVDLVAEGAHLHFSRWLFQCKNQTSPVGLSVLAKEIGMATLLRAQVIVIVTTGQFTKSVSDYAREAAESTAIQIVLLDGGSLSNYRSRGPAGLREELHRFALGALRRKRHQLDVVPRD